MERAARGVAGVDYRGPPRGISRHIVRFAYLEGKVVAVKEIGESVAHHEYETLRNLNRLDAPCVEPLAVITGRYDDAGEPSTPPS